MVLYTPLARFTVETSKIGEQDKQAAYRGGRRGGAARCSGSGGQVAGKQRGGAARLRLLAGPAAPLSLYWFLLSVI
jgi:hypothetical protein